MSTSIILAIDTGSSSIRCTAFNLLNNVEPGTPPIQAMGIYHSIPLPCIIPSTGYIRIHEILTTIDQCIDNVISSLRPSLSDYRIVAIGFSTFVMNLVGVDEMGEPVGETATCSYACNRKDVVRECQELKQNMSPEELQALYQETGAPLHSAYALPQLLAFYNNDANRGIMSKVYRWQTISSICIHRWMGGGKIDVPISYSEASWTGMLDFRTCTWNRTILDILNACPAIRCSGGIFGLLPELADLDGTNTTETTTSLFCNGLSSCNKNGEANPYWERWPELRATSTHYDNEQMQQCRMFLGIGDGAAANCGSKCDAYSSSDGTRIAVTVGTSAAARVCLPLPIETSPSNKIVIPFGLFCYRIDKSQVLVGGALTDGGRAIEWARNLLNLKSGEDFEAALEEVSDQYYSISSKLELDSPPSPPSQSSVGTVTMIPFLSGERSTGFRGSASACISGITRDTSATDILHGCLQGVTPRLRAVIGLIKNVHKNKTDDGGQTRLVVSGTALERNSLWRQMIADCTGFDVVVDGDSSGGTSRGVAMLITKSIHLAERCEEALSIVSQCQPNPNTRLRWKIAAREQENLITAVSKTWDM